MINFIRLREAFGHPRASTINSATQKQKHMQNQDSILKFANAGIKGLNEVVGVWGGKGCCKKSTKKKSTKCKSSKSHKSHKSHKSSCGSRRTRSHGGCY